MEKEGVAAGVAGGRRRRRWDPGEAEWGGAGCASVRRSVSQSVRATREPASPACSALLRQEPGLAPLRSHCPRASPLPRLFTGSSRSPRLARRGAARHRQPGRPSPLAALALPASPSARALALALAPSRSSHIYEARSHHVLMSLCPALAAAQAQTPPRELRGEGPARGAARRLRLQTLLALGTRQGARPRARGD